MAGLVSLSIGRFQGLLGDEGALETAQELGFSCVDLDLTRYECGKEGSLYEAGADAVAAHFTAVRKKADALGVKIGQTHGRIRAYKTDEAHNERELAAFRYDALATQILGAPCCVVHAVHLGLDASAEDQRTYNMRMFADFLPIAHEHDILLASETLGDTHAPDGRQGVDFFGDVKEFLRAHHAIRAANPLYADRLCMCMDTGHTNKASRFGLPLPGDFIRMCGADIRCLHLNDNDTLTDQHKIPLSGTIDWPDVMRALGEIGYRGDYNMELSLTHFGKSLATMRAYATLARHTMEELLKQYS